MRLIISIFVLIFFSAALIFDAKALAVASDYLEDNTLKLAEGNSTIYSIRLQNPEKYELRVKVDYDRGLMQTIDLKDEYILQPEETASVKFNITAPKYKKGENILPLTYTVHQLGTGSGGLGFSPKISKGFKLEVIRDTNRFYVDPVYIVLAAMALAFLLFAAGRKIISPAKSWKKFPKRKLGAFKSRKLVK